jgi:hypothetical protein
MPAANRRGDCAHKQLGSGKQATNNTKNAPVTVMIGRVDQGAGQFAQVDFVIT